MICVEITDIKVAYIGTACIRDICGMGTYINGTSVRNTSNMGIYIRYISLRDIFNINIYIEGISFGSTDIKYNNIKSAGIEDTVNYLKIYLQLS